MSVKLFLAKSLTPRTLISWLSEKHPIKIITCKIQLQNFHAIEYVQNFERIRCSDDVCLPFLLLVQGGQGGLEFHFDPKIQK